MQRIAMMLPPVMPAVLLHRRLIQARVERGERAAGSHLLLFAGYFSIWVAFGAMAYAIGMTVAAAAMRSPLDAFARHEIRRATDSWRFGVH